MVAANTVKMSGTLRGTRLRTCPYCQALGSDTFGDVSHRSPYAEREELVNQALLLLGASIVHDMTNSPARRAI
jgi:hypothetical protein